MLNNDIKVLFNRLHKDAQLPKYGSPYAAGCDLYAVEKVNIGVNEIRMISCGFSMEFNNGLEAQVRPRSGLAIKEGITVVNAPGTIDSDYRGEVKVGLINLGKESYTVKAGDRIAQMVFAPVYRAHFLETTDGLSNTDRGTGGFGSSGR